MLTDFEDLDLVPLELEGGGFHVFLSDGLDGDLVPSPLVSGELDDSELSLADIFNHLIVVDQVGISRSFLQPLDPSLVVALFLEVQDSGFLGGNLNFDCPLGALLSLGVPEALLLDKSSLEGVHELVGLHVLRLVEVDLLPRDPREVLSEVARLGLQEDNSLEVFVLFLGRPAQRVESFDDFARILLFRLFALLLSVDGKPETPGGRVAPRASPAALASVDSQVLRVYGLQVVTLHSRLVGS